MPSSFLIWFFTIWWFCSFLRVYSSALFSPFPYCCFSFMVFVNGQVFCSIYRSLCCVSCYYYYYWFGEFSNTSVPTECLMHVPACCNPFIASCAVPCFVSMNPMYVDLKSTCAHWFLFCQPSQDSVNCLVFLYSVLYKFIKIFCVFVL